MPHADLTNLYTAQDPDAAAPNPLELAEPVPDTVASLVPAPPSPTREQATPARPQPDLDALRAPAGRRTLSTRKLAWHTVRMDSLIIVASMVLAWPLRGLVPGMPPATASWYELAALVAPGIWLIWMLLLGLYGAYARRVFGAGADEFRNVVKGSLTAGLVVTAIIFFAETPLSRGFLVGSFVLGTVFLLLHRYAGRKSLHRLRRQGHLTHRTLLVGSAGAILGIHPSLERAGHLGYEVIACTLVHRPGGTAMPAPVVGTLGDIAETCRRLDIDTVMVVGGIDADLREVAWALEGTQVDLVVVPRLADVSGSRLHMRPVAGLPLVHVEVPQASQAGEWPKRVFDLVGASTVLFLAAPLMLLIALLIKLGDRGPVLYRQPRVGLDGRLFDCWKFRSMVVGADRIDAQLRAEHGYAEGLFKLERDPRVTRVGRVLRRYSIDELPQLFNVIQGSMSLVGPRPHLPVEVDTYSDHAHRRLSVRPGMTGLWQVSGRSDLSWDDSVRLDLYYRDNW